MRGFILLICSLIVATNCFYKSISEPINDEVQNLKEPVFITLDQLPAFDSTNWLDFELTCSEELNPIVSLLCGSLDYVEMSITPGWREWTIVNRLQKSVCSNVPKDMRLDFSYLKECLRDPDCFQTNKFELLLGLTDENVFFTHYNVSTVPKAPIVATCLQEGGSCPKEKEARDLLNNWKYLLEHCDQAEDKKEIEEAAEGVLMVAAESSDESLYSWYEQSLSNCLILTPSPEIKRMMAEKLKPTATCSDHVRDKLLEYVENDSSAPMDVAMTVTRQLMSCDNETLVHMIEDMLLKNDNEYKTGFAVWETMKMMADERYQLRKRRDIETTFDQTLDRVVSSPELQQKWNSAPYTWKYTYTLEETAWSGKTIYTAIVSFDLTAEQPLATIRLSEVSSYPPMENHIVIALETELIEELNKFINGETVDIAKVYKYVTEEGLFIPFKLSLLMLADDFDLTSEGFSAFGQQFAAQLAQIEASLAQLPKVAKISLNKIGDTTVGIDFNYDIQENGVVITVVGKLKDDTEFLDAVLNSEITKNEKGEVGLSVTGKLDFMDAEVYEVKAVYEPLTENPKGKTQCEMSIDIYGKTSGKTFLSLSSCVRPVYIGDPSEPLSPLANMYRILEIPNYLKMNFTLDFGTNGFIGFFSSPKNLLFNIHYMDSLVAEFAAQMKFVNERTYSRRRSKKEKSPMFQTITSAEVKIPKVSEKTASLQMTSKMFEDFSATSAFELFTFPDIDGIENSYEGFFDASSCATGIEDLVTNMMFAQTVDDLPEKVCYDVTLRLPENLGSVSQQFKYEFETSDFIYNYDLDLTSENTKLSGQLWLAGDGGEKTFTCSVTNPMEADIVFTNMEKEFPTLDGKMSHLYMGQNGLFVNLEPMEGLCDESFAGSFSTVEHTSILESEYLPGSYSFCSFDESEEPFMYGEFHCDFAYETAGKKMSIANTGEQFEVETKCDYGSVKVMTDLEQRVWGSVSDEEATDVAKFDLTFSSLSQPPLFTLSVKPDDEPLCTLIDFEGVMTDDIFNEQCFNETLGSLDMEEFSDEYGILETSRELLQSVNDGSWNEMSADDLVAFCTNLYYYLLSQFTVFTGY